MAVVGCWPDVIEGRLLSKTQLAHSGLGPGLMRNDWIWRESLIIAFQT